MAADVGTSTGSSTAVVDRPSTLSRRLDAGASSKHFSLSSSETRSRKYKHVFAIHSEPKTSCLSHESLEAPSFLGFRNLMVLVLIVGNLRLVMENYMKYGFIISLQNDIEFNDLKWGAFLYILIPAHLFVAYLIELVAAAQARSAHSKTQKDQEPPKLKAAWMLIAFAHGVNATLSLYVANYVVYYRIYHPLIGTLCEIHAVIVWLKQLSYAFTNRDLRDAYLEDYPAPDIYASCPYPQNIALGNLCYFWWAPTLVYQPVYPRSPKFRLGFFLKRVGEVIGLSIAIWFLSAQYAVPLLRNSLHAMGKLNLPVILERLMKLSTISLVIWLAGFFALFQSGLNALAELLQFGDREFYTDWWNSGSVGTYWRTWNKPVYHFMKRHIAAPLVGRGVSPTIASVIVFTFSAILHEIVVGVPTHNIIGVAFAGMFFQIPLIAITQRLEKKNGPPSLVGNAIFWISFCLVGQPLAALLYFFAWQAKYGGVHLKA
ncbi:hypothetical protein DFH27DRAFT_591050 [Peziza echinospora]|nr:hypothetical protein DFH27DRAFT_591050 [Peziza echinospora]